jgi:hypothetical protein
MNVV